MTTLASVQQNWIVCRFWSEIWVKSALKVVANGPYTAKQQPKNPHAGEIGKRESDVPLLKRNITKNPYAGETGKGESHVRLLPAWRISVQNYSVQYKGSNLIGVTTVERGDGSYDSTNLFRITYAFIYRVCAGVLTVCPQVHAEAIKTDLHNTIILSK